jgi:hypothetical protein
MIREGIRKAQKLLRKMKTGTSGRPIAWKNGTLRNTMSVVKNIH